MNITFRFNDQELDNRLDLYVQMECVPRVGEICNIGWMAGTTILEGRIPEGDFRVDKVVNELRAVSKGSSVRWSAFICVFLESL